MRKTSLKLAAIAIALFIAASTSAQTIIYDNSSGAPNSGTITGDNPVTGETTLSLGDVVSFAGGANTLGNFQLEYYVSGNGNENITVNLWNMNGTAGQPGTSLYTSGLLPADASGLHAHSFDSGTIALAVPDTITWTITFSGVDPGETAGLYFYNGPQVGTSPTFAGNHFYYRHNTDGSWDLLSTTLSDNLGARFTSAVPEPSTWALLVGGLGTLGFMARRRKA